MIFVPAFPALPCAESQASYVREALTRAVGCHLTVGYANANGYEAGNKACLADFCGNNICGNN